MGKVKIKVGKKAVEEAGKSGDFEQPKPGVYTATLVECKPGFTKGDDGKPDKSRPYLECIYQIDGVGREGKKPEVQYSRLWDYVSFSEASEWKQAQFGIAMGLEVTASGGIDGSIETEENKPGTVIGRKVVIRVKKDSDQEGNYRGKIASVMPADGGADLDAGDDGEILEGDEDVVEEDNPFGEDSEGDEEDYLTEEDLEALSLKELGALASNDFDLTPQEHIVKVKGKVDQDQTKAALIAAILEAQGAEDEDGETGNDDGEEDPF